ncbi:MAG: patatin family protein [Clostridiales bacterium]|nr:patatin family protein [Clostridiales bacterium]
MRRYIIIGQDHKEDTILDKTPSALIMEGGAMRGMFTCGVIDVFMENNIDFDGAAGISAGAAFGCNFKSRQIGRPIRYNKKYGKDPRYASLRSLIKTGDYFGAEFCYETLPFELDLFDTKAFSENPLKFFVGATDVDTGKIVYHLCTDGGKNDILWMRASASMPLVSRVVEADGHRLLDGGIVDTVPYAYMESLGYKRNVIVLTQPKGYIKKKSRGNLLFKTFLRKYPAVVEGMEHRHEMYNRQMKEIEERETRGESFVIRPPCDLGISRTENDPQELERVYQIGRNEATKALPKIREFLHIPD